MRNPSLFGLLCFLLIVDSAAFAAEHAGQVVAIDEILQNNLKAVRAQSSLDNVENANTVLQISEADYTVLARYRASADGYMRIDVFSDDARVFSEGKDEEGVWEWRGGKAAPENVYHDGIGALEHGIEFNLFPLARLPGRGHDVELVGRETIRDKEYFVLKVTLSDGFETYRYVNAETWLVDLSRDFRAFHPGIDDTKKNLETRYDQWERTDGVVFAGRMQNVDLETGAVIATTLILGSGYNVAREELNLARSYVPGGAPKLSE